MCLRKRPMHTWTLDLKQKAVFPQTGSAGYPYGKNEMIYCFTLDPKPRNKQINLRWL